MAQDERRAPDEGLDQLDEDVIQQLDEVALHVAAHLGSAPSAAGPVFSEVGDIPEDELERVDANTFRVVKVLSSFSHLVQPY
jgi:hypothetical protein